MLDTITVAEFIHEYWYVLLALVAMVAVASVYAYNWFKMPNNEQIEQIKQWLLFAVAKAEKELGSGTGKIKLRYVYDMFIAKFPAVALFISFEEFANLVDEALQELEELMRNNVAIESLVNGEEDN